MPEGKSVSETLSEQWDKLSGGGEQEASGQAEGAPEAQDEAPLDSDAAPETSEGEPTDAAPAPPPEVSQKKPVVPTPKPKPGKDSKPPPSAQSTAAGPKPPQSWPVAVREHWGKLPPEVQAQVDKTEREVRKVLQDTVAARKTATAFEETIKPYKPFMTAEPIKEVEGLLQTAVALRTGPKETRAAIVAHLLHTSDAPVDLVATFYEKLRGIKTPTDADATPPTPDPQPRHQAQQQEFRDPEFAAFKESLKQRAQAMAQARKQRHLGELQAFAESGRAEFFYDVLPQMEVVQAAAQRDGEDLSVEELYERACYLNKSVRPLWEQRRAATQAAANASKASTQPRTRVATSSARHEPTAPANGKRELSRREELEANWDRLAARR